MARSRRNATIAWNNKLKREACEICFHLPPIICGKKTRRVRCFTCRRLVCVNCYDAKDSLRTQQRRNYCHEHSPQRARHLRKEVSQ